jgi:GxxExxY protein
MVVEGRVLLELKSVSTLSSIHSKQLLTYLRLSGLRIGLLINFGEMLPENGIVRLINDRPVGWSMRIDHD